MTEAIEMDVLPELGFYGLAGGATTPAPLLDEVRRGEDLGFGTCFLSERFNVKEAASLCGAAGAVSSRLDLSGRRLWVRSSHDRGGRDGRAAGTGVLRAGGRPHDTGAAARRGAEGRGPRLRDLLLVRALQREGGRQPVRGGRGRQLPP